MERSLIPVSVLVQTKNEELAIAECLSHLRDFAEVVVVDSLSTDRTVEIAVACGARVEHFDWNGRYPKKKQWQLEHLHTQHEWVLFLDADEVPSPQLVESMRRFFASSTASDAAAVDIRLDYVFAGKLLKHGHRVVKRALVHRGRVAFPEVDDLGAPGMGELEGHYQPEASGEVVALPGRLLHHDLDPVRTWFDRHNKYSDWEAYLRRHREVGRAVAGRRSAKGRIFDALPFKPLVFFVYGYVLRGGFLDGRAGLDYAVALSTYYWQIGLKVRELDREAGAQP